MGRTRFLKTNCVFKCIVKMSNGMHKVVRMTIDKVATFAAAMRCLRECPWLTRRYEDFFSELGINYRNVESCRFINEWTGEELLSI